MNVKNIFGSSLNPNFSQFSKIVWCGRRSLWIENYCRCILYSGGGGGGGDGDGDDDDQMVCMYVRAHAIPVFVKMMTRDEKRAHRLKTYGRSLNRHFSLFFWSLLNLLRFRTDCLTHNTRVVCNYGLPIQVMATMTANAFYGNSRFSILQPLQIFKSHPHNCNWLLFKHLKFFFFSLFLSVVPHNFAYPSIISDRNP